MAKATDFIAKVTLDQINDFCSVHSNRRIPLTSTIIYPIIDAFTIVSRGNIIDVDALSISFWTFKNTAFYPVTEFVLF